MAVTDRLLCGTVQYAMSNIAYCAVQMSEAGIQKHKCDVQLFLMTVSNVSAKS